MSRVGARGGDDGFVDFAHGFYVVGAYVEEIGFAVAGGEDAGGGEVFGVDELVAVGAIADDPDGLAVVDEFEEDGEETETAGVHDGGQRMMTTSRSEGELAGRACSPASLDLP